MFPPSALYALDALCVPNAVFSQFLASALCFFVPFLFLIPLSCLLFLPFFLLFSFQLARGYFQQQPPLPYNAGREKHRVFTDQADIEVGGGLNYRMFR